MTRVGISGHQSIPPAARKSIEAGIEKSLISLGGGVRGITSLASGADQLFAELVLQLGGRLVVVIPSSHYEATFAGDALTRYRQLLLRADEVEQMPAQEPNEHAFLLAGQRVVDLSDVLIAVWDGTPARGKGGTADIVNYAREKSIQVRIVWPDGVERD